MKKLASVAGLIFFILAFISTSCKKDAPLNEQLIGKWEVKSIQQVNYEGNIKISETTFFSKENELSFQFVDGGTGVEYKYGIVYGVFTWELTNNTLKIDTGNEVLEWSITIDNNVLVWSFSSSEINGGITYKYEYFYTANKVG